MASTMVEYVYALHDFHPENDDEVDFRAGERIEVLEKDEQYSDGWWQGRNLGGKVGLFPQSYTAPAPPVAGPSDPASGPALLSSSTFLQPLHEVPEPVDRPDSSHSQNGRLSTVHDGEVMKATMTDVQKAIEQLGRSDRDGGSFSFSSSRDGDSTDHEIESDADQEGADWHREARLKLAEQSRRVVEAAREEEDREFIRSTAPPIHVEMSDESEAEDEDVEDIRDRAPSRQFSPYPNIPEDDEGEVVHSLPNGKEEHGAEDVPLETVVDRSGDDLEVPENDEDMHTAKAAQTSFGTAEPGQGILHFPPPPTSIPEETLAETQITPPPSDTGSALNTVVPYPPVNESPVKAISQMTVSQITISQTPTITSNLSPAPVLPSPVASITASHSPDAPQSKHNSVASKLSTGILSVAPVASPKTANPADWTVDDVVDWLKSKGFEQDICDKFIEQDISGDVLLELNVELLKSEIGIIAFGKRKRIANAIIDLRRPPSLIYSDTPLSTSHSQVPTSATYVAQTPAGTHSYSHSHSHSLQSSAHPSLNSPFGLSPGVLSQVLSPESPPQTGDLAVASVIEKRHMSDPTSLSNLAVTDVDDSANSIATAMQKSTVGLGLEVPPSGTPNGKATKSRPAQLTLSPSDGAIGNKPVISSAKSEAEERAALSENEAAPPTSSRRNIFAKSTGSDTSSRPWRRESGNSKLSAGSKDADAASDSGRGVGNSDDRSVSSRRGTRRNRSVDTSKPSDRLSLFGGTIHIGKSRKPPPRYSTYNDHDQPTEKTSTLNLSKLYGSSSRKSANSQSSVRDKVSSPKDKDGPKDRDSRDSAVLRKRTLSAASPTASKPDRGKESSPHRNVGPLQPGLSVLDQIGEPDYSGWMRKRGERYNTWKLRYLVLKGPHLYYMRSDSKTETKIKGYINIIGYKVVADENVNPGRYGFRILHDTEKSHYFSSEEKAVIREWMKAIMKATIGRDYTKPVVSSCNIPTIPLSVAQAMNPAPRPPSPTQRAATQKSFRRDNPNQLSTRDARILMGLPSNEDDRGKEPAAGDVFANGQHSGSTNSAGYDVGAKNPAFAPPRPSRDLSRNGSMDPVTTLRADASLIEWANSHLPPNLKITDPSGPLTGGLGLLRLAESVKGTPAHPPVPDSAFPSGPHDDKLDGLFRLFDFLLDNDVKMGSVSINDIRTGKRDKTVQLLKALRAWEEKKKAADDSVVAIPNSGYISPVTTPWGNI